MMATIIEILNWLDDQSRFLLSRTANDRVIGGTLAGNTLFMTAVRAALEEL